MQYDSAAPKRVSDQLSTARHYYNEIAYTHRPFMLGWFVGIVSTYVVCRLKYVKSSYVFIESPMRYDNGMLPFYDYYSVGRAYDSLFPITMLGLFIGVINHWGTDMSSESDFDGRYARKVRASLFFGFVFFPVSEVMLFGGFFRAYFDRVFNPSYATGCISIPTGMESIDFSRWPLVGTIVLITSGYFANHAYYVLRIGSHSDFIYNIALAIILAFVFLAIQLFEYNGLALTISDSVYGSFFYLPTGFHGFHVTVGLLFLIMQYGRFIEACPDHIKDLDRESTPRDYFAIYDSGRNTGLCCALIYWHFVDITRIFSILKRVCI